MILTERVLWKILNGDLDFLDSFSSSYRDALIKEIVDYLNKKAGMNYKAASKVTQHHIHARLEEGFVLDDFKTVIDKKCGEWIGTDFAQYLRPVTLFGTKFEAYLNAPEIKRRNYGQTGVEIQKPETDDLAGIL